jgi:phage gpG-like protein
VAENFELDEGDALRVLSKVAGGDATAALTKVGALLVASSQRAFRDQAFNGVMWPPRLVPNIPGIVSDLNRGVTPPARRFQERPALVDTGNLRRSITFNVDSPTSVVVGTSVPYASVHQTGGQTVVQVNDQGRAGLAKLLGTARGRQFQAQLGAALNSEAIFRNVPSRPFVGLQKTDAAKIEQILGQSIEEGG